MSAPVCFRWPDGTSRTEYVGPAVITGLYEENDKLARSISESARACHAARSAGLAILARRRKALGLQRMFGEWKALAASRLAEARAMLRLVERCTARTFARRALWAWSRRAAVDCLASQCGTLRKKIARLKADQSTAAESALLDQAVTESLSKQLERESRSVSELQDQLVLQSRQATIMQKLKRALYRDQKQACPAASAFCVPAVGMNASGA